MELSFFSFKKLKLYIKKFEESENKVKAIHFLKEILIILEKNSYNDEKFKKFLDKVQEELNFSLETNWKKIQLDFPEMNCSYSVNKYMFIEDELRETKINNQTAWDHLQKNIISIFDRYEIMFNQMVPLHII